MITIWIARISMITSWMFFAGIMVWTWASAMMGSNELLWDAYDFPPETTLPHTWVLLIGLANSALIMFGLGISYWSVETILKDGPDQDFLQLGQRLRKMAIGLIVFWIGFNLLVGAIPNLLVAHIPENQAPELGWQPFDVEFILLIVAVALFAISRSLNRAHELEEENRQFL